MDANGNGGSSGGGSVGSGRRDDDVAMGGAAKGAAAQGKAAGGQRRPRVQASGGAGANRGKLSERDYARIWYKKLASFHSVKNRNDWRFNRDQLIEFLRAEKRGGAPTWKRLKMVESIDLYQRAHFAGNVLDVSDIRETLRLHAEKERSNGSSSRTGSSSSIQSASPTGSASSLGVVDEEAAPPIEESVGLIDPREPEVIRELRRALRLHQRELETERAYVGHVRAFMRSRSLDSLESCAKIGPKDVEAFLSDKAVRGKVSESTQDQAFFALFISKPVRKGV